MNENNPFMQLNTWLDECTTQIENRLQAIEKRLSALERHNMLSEERSERS